jgi:hypothetical protein
MPTIRHALGEAGTIVVTTAVEATLKVEILRLAGDHPVICVNSPNVATGPNNAQDGRGSSGAER